MIDLKEDSIQKYMTSYRYPKPVLHGSGKEGSFDSKGVDIPFVFKHYGKYYMVYTGFDGIGYQSALAVSDNLFYWERYEGNPVLKVSEDAWDQTFVSDPYVVQDSDKWVCYYYGIGGLDLEDNLYHAEEGLALSDNLLDWEKVKDPILGHGRYGDYDHHHAHKPAMFYEDGVLYHFYCATCAASDEYPTELFDEYRTICVACSKPVIEK